MISAPVKFAGDCVGEEAESAVAGLQDGEVLLLENVRFYAEEEANDPEFSEKLASLGDIYVNDAFGTAHRAHASTEGVTKFIDTCAAGFLMERELEYLVDRLEEPARPFIVIMGGAKVSDKQALLSEIDPLKRLHLARSKDQDGGIDDQLFVMRQRLQIERFLVAECGIKAGLAHAGGGDDIAQAGRLIAVFPE